MKRNLKSSIAILLVVVGHGALIGAVWCFSFGLGCALFGCDNGEELTRGLDLSDWQSVLLFVVFGGGVGIVSLAWFILGMVPIFGWFGMKIDDPGGWIRRPLERLSQLWMRAFEEPRIPSGRVEADKVEGD